MILETHNISKIIATHNSVEFSKLSIMSHVVKKYLLNAYCVLWARQALCHNPDQVLRYKVLYNTNPQGKNTTLNLNTEDKTKLGHLLL